MHAYVSKPCQMDPTRTQQVQNPTTYRLKTQSSNSKPNNSKTRNSKLKNSTTPKSKLKTQTETKSRNSKLKELEPRQHKHQNPTPNNSKYSKPNTEKKQKKLSFVATRECVIRFAYQWSSYAFTRWALNKKLQRNMTHVQIASFTSIRCIICCLEQCILEKHAGHTQHA